jgi:hypothetical protein
VTFVGNLFQRNPECVFEADAGLLSINDDRTFGHQGFHAFAPTGTQKLEALRRIPAQPYEEASSPTRIHVRVQPRQSGFSPLAYCRCCVGESSRFLPK